MPSSPASRARSNAWWLVPVATVGAAAAIWAIFDREARDARNQWERDWKRVQRSVEDHRRNIQRNLNRAQTSYDFHLLVDLHFSSFRVADHAYSSLRDARKSLDAMGKMLVQAKHRKNELIQKKRAAPFEERQQIQAEIDILTELRDDIFPDKDAVKQQRDELHSELKRLNNQTHQLKIAIRDRCGYKGRDWYNRLEERKARNRRRK